METCHLKQDIDETDGIATDVLSVGVAAKAVYDEVIADANDACERRSKIKRIGASVIGFLLAISTLGASVGFITEGSHRNIQNACSSPPAITPVRTLVATSLSIEALLSFPTRNMTQNLSSSFTRPNEDNDVDLDLKAPFTMMIVGPT